MHIFLFSIQTKAELSHILGKQNPVKEIAKFTAKLDQKRYLCIQTWTKALGKFKVSVLKRLFSFLFSTFNYFHFLECLSYAMQNITKTHLLSFTLQSGVAMSYDRAFIQETRVRVTQFLKPPENAEPKNISLQDLLLSNTNFYSQFLQLLVAQTIIFLAWRFEKSGFHCT